MIKSLGFVYIFFLTVSFTGLVLIAVFAGLPQSAEHGDSWRKPLVGISFSIICVLGILAGVFPSKCSKIFHFKEEKQNNVSPNPNEMLREKSILKGHHPDCGSFDIHVFRLGDKVFCAGCIGLVLGAIFSLMGNLFYFFINQSFPIDYLLAFFIGTLGVSCGLLQYHLPGWGRSSVHLSVNTAFVFGVFLLLVGVDGLMQNLVIDLYLISLSIFWLYTRILFSQIDHKKICNACQLKECSFSRNTKL